LRNGSIGASEVAVIKELRIKPSVGEVSPVNPHAVKGAMGEQTNTFLGLEQRDAHEFVSDLVDHIHEKLEQKKASDEDVTTPTTPMDV
jgi:ubiquitin C-terminal hydrolase